jgi:hypothetical protein
MAVVVQAGSNHRTRVWASPLIAPLALGSIGRVLRSPEIGRSTFQSSFGAARLNR